MMIDSSSSVISSRIAGPRYAGGGAPDGGRTVSALGDVSAPGDAAAAGDEGCAIWWR